MIPSFFTGMRLAMTGVLLGVLLAELYVSIIGIGYFTSVFTENFEPTKLLGPITMLAVMAILLNELVRRAELHFTRWRTACTRCAHHMEIAVGDRHFRPAATRPASGRASSYSGNTDKKPGGEAHHRHRRAPLRPPLARGFALPRHAGVKLEDGRRQIMTASSTRAF